MVKPITTPAAESLSTKDYLETRLNLITEKMKDAEQLQKEALAALAEATKAAALASDLRYQQRFEAQSDALTAALQAAKEAVQAAQAAADRAVAKAEAAADKRFEALNELRQMLNDMVATMLTRKEADQQFKSVEEKHTASENRTEQQFKASGDKNAVTEAHIVRVESRLDQMQGVDVGSRQTKIDTRALIGLAITVLLALLGLATFIFARMKP
jgi:hypothetical protein